MNKQLLLVTSPMNALAGSQTHSLGLASTLCWQHCKCCGLHSVHNATPISQHLHNARDTTSCAAICLLSP